MGKYKSCSEAIRDIWYKKGILNGFYSGFAPLALREIPFSQIQYPAYEMLKKMSVRALAFKTGMPSSALEVPAYLNLVNGCIAGGIAGYLTNPFDVLKTKIMLEESPESKKVHNDTKQQSEP